jgi:O-antigen/teichoic acid export membrane protein
VTSDAKLAELPRTVRRALGGHRDLLANALSLFGTTAITSVLGFGFWWLAARLFPVAAVGYASAALSSMMLLGVVGMGGLGTILITELARRPARPGSLLTASLLVSAGLSAALGLGFVLVAPVVTGHPVPFAADPVTMGLYVLGTALTGATLVLDQALIGLLQGGLQLHRNVAAAVAKLALLGAAGALAADRVGTGIVVAWVVGTAGSVVVLAVLVRRRGLGVRHPPDWMIMRSLTRPAALHNWLNLTALLPGYVLPVMATGLVSPAAGAAFYVVWNLLNIVTIVPFHLSTVLQAIGAADERKLASKLRVTLRLALLAGVVGVPLLVAGAPLLLGAFGPVYAEQGTSAMRLLSLTYFTWVFQACYVSICRVHGRLARAAVVMTVSGLLELGAAAAGAARGGLAGLSVGLLAAMVVAAVLTAPTVWRTAQGKGARP